MPVYVKKYTGSNYFQSRTIVDSITLTRLPDDAFPIFRYETEDFGSVGTYRAGDFDIYFRLSDPALSSGGYNTKEFFLGTQRDYYYLVIVVIGAQSFSGIAQQSQISGDFTYSKGKLEIRVTCKDILIEWSKRCSTVPNSTIVINNEHQKTFEEYMPLHFGGITSGVVLLSLPSSYLARLLPYGNPVNCYAKGNYLNAILDQVNISRWETFKELALGLGFNFEMYLNLGTETTNEPEFIFNIFFVDDLSNETPTAVNITDHAEFTTAARMEWLYLKVRHFVVSEGEYSQGIFFNSLTQYDCDSNNALDDLYPALFSYINGRVLSYIDDNSNTLKTILRDVDFTELELKQYNYEVPIGAEQGKLYPLDELGVLSGGMSYSAIFNCITGSGTIIDYYNHLPIQRYAILNYKRYLKGLQKAKTLVVDFNSDTNLKTWRVITVNDGNGAEKYYISAINRIDLKRRKAEIDAILLPN